MKRPRILHTEGAIPLVILIETRGYVAIRFSVSHRSTKRILIVSLHVGKRLLERGHS